MTASSVLPPLPFENDPAIAREELHFRRIDMRGYRRSDGLYEVEGQLTDRKPHDFQPASGGRPARAGEPIHDMGVRLVFDDDMTVREVQTFTRCLLPPGRVTACTVWMFGFHRRLVRRWECDTDLPKPGPFPQISHTAAM